LDDGRLDDAHAALGGMGRVLSVILESVSQHWAIKLAHPVPSTAVSGGGAVALHYGSYDRKVRLNHSRAELLALLEVLLVARRCEAALRSAVAVLSPAVQARSHAWTQRLVHGLISEQMGKASDKGTDGIQ